LRVDNQEKQTAGDTMIKPYYQDEWVTIYNGDALEILPELDPVNIIIADPPYNFTTASAGNGKLNPWADLCNSAYWFSAWMKLCFERMASNQGCMWQFCNWRTIPTITKASFDIGKQIESLLVWDKIWIGPGGQRGLRPSFELVALLCHPDFQVKDRGIPDIKRCLWSSIKPNGHPAEKPAALIKWLIDISGDGTVLDPFLGCGTTLVSAKELGHKAIGIEIDEAWCEIAAKRCMQTVMNFEPVKEKPKQGVLMS